MITILKKRRSQKNEVETVALLQDLIQQIDDPTLRDRILQETDKLIKQKSLGSYLRNICRNAHRSMTCQFALAQRLR